VVRLKSNEILDVLIAAAAPAFHQLPVGRDEALPLRCARAGNEAVATSVAFTAIRRCFWH
jgi:hypothetical protein